jgi:hypothetical protein
MKIKFNLILLGLFFQVYFSSCTMEKRVYNRGLNVQVYAFQKRDFKEIEVKKAKPERFKINPEAKDAITIDEKSNTFIERSNTPKEQNSIFGNKSLDVKIQHSKKLRKENHLAYKENSSFVYTEGVRNDSFVDREDIEYKAESSSKLKSNREFESYSYLSILALIVLGSIGGVTGSLAIFILGALGSIVLSVMGLYRLIKSPGQWKLKFFSYFFAILGFLFGLMALLLSGWWDCC